MENLVVIQSIFDQDEYLVDDFHVQLHPLTGGVNCNCGKSSCRHIMAVMRGMGYTSLSQWRDNNRYTPRPRLSIRKPGEQVRGKSIE